MWPEWCRQGTQQQADWYLTLNFRKSWLCFYITWCYVNWKKYNYVFSFFFFYVCNIACCCWKHIARDTLHSGTGLLRNTDISGFCQQLTLAGFSQWKLTREVKSESEEEMKRDPHLRLQRPSKEGLLFFANKIVTVEKWKMYPFMFFFFFPSSTVQYIGKRQEGQGIVCRTKFQSCRRGRLP